MIAIVAENVIFATCELFWQLLKYTYKVLLRHLSLTQVYFSIELVLCCFWVHYNNAALFAISRYYAITVFLATDYIIKICTWFRLLYDSRPSLNMWGNCWQLWSHKCSGILCRFSWILFRRSLFVVNVCMILFMLVYLWFEFQGFWDNLWEFL